MNTRQWIAALSFLTLVFSSAPSIGQNESLARGLVHGCMDAQERQLKRPLTRDDKKFILNFCYCRAPGIAALMPDERSKQKMLLKEPEFMAAVARIDAGCHEGIKAGRRFYP